MRHFSEMVLVRTRNGLPVPGQVKEISFNDFYLPHSRAGREKLGNVQSFGRIPPADVSMNALPHFWRAFSPLIRRLWRLAATANVLVGVMEDLPYADNRVLPGAPLVGGPRQRIRLQYRPQLQSADARRPPPVHRVARPYRSIAFRNGEARGRPFVRHVPERTDPASSVLDRHNRDMASITCTWWTSLPSSGINPGLTIVNACASPLIDLNERFDPHGEPIEWRMESPPGNTAITCNRAAASCGVSTASRRALTKARNWHAYVTAPRRSRIAATDLRCHVTKRERWINDLDRRLSLSWRRTRSVDHSEQVTSAVAPSEVRRSARASPPAAPRGASAVGGSAPSSRTSHA